MPEGKTAVLDTSLPREALIATMGDYTTRCNAIVIVSSISPTTRGKSLLPDGDMARFVREITESKIPTILISLGSPYLLGAYPNASAYMATFSTTDLSELAAAKALFGEIAISGHMPVTIPGYSKFGDGIQLSIHPR